MKMVVLVCVMVSCILGISGCDNPLDGPNNVDQGTDELPIDIGSEEIPLACASKCEPLFEEENYGTKAEQLACSMKMCGDVLLDARIEAPQSYPEETQTTPNEIFNCSLSELARSQEAEQFNSDDLGELSGDTFVVLSNSPLGLEKTSFGEPVEQCDTGRANALDNFVNTDVEGYVNMRDIVELTLTLKAPEDANAVKIRYQFESTIDSGEKFEGGGVARGNDKFYLFYHPIGGKYVEREILNYRTCEHPDTFWTTECTDVHMGCGLGEKVCSMGTFAIFDECCFMDCFQDEADDSQVGCVLDVAAAPGVKKDSTGWLETTRTVEPGEEFELIFHLHDAGDPFGTSSVYIDSVHFVTSGENGTVEVD